MMVFVMSFESVVYLVMRGRGSKLYTTTLDV